MDIPSTPPSYVPPPPTPAQQSWGALISIIIIVLMIIVGAFYAWGRRIAEQPYPVAEPATTPAP